MSVKEVDYQDRDGVMRRVMVPDDGIDHDPQEGIPVDMFDEIIGIYHDASANFRYNLCKALWQRGLIYPADYLQPGADKAYRQALTVAIKHDIFSVQTLAKMRLDHG